VTPPAPTLEQLPLTAYTPCDEPWPPSRHDVHLLRCVLIHGHRSDEHWSGPLWRGHGGIVWVSDEV
jgi:hypothetical protein